MEQKLLLVFQQSELDAVKMYQVLTDKAAGEDEKQLLRQLGAVEGRHAAVLRGITGVSDLKPTDKMAKPIGLLREKLGAKGTYTLLALGEHGAYFLYQPLAKKYDLPMTLENTEPQNAEAARLYLEQFGMKI